MAKRARSSPCHDVARLLIPLTTSRAAASAPSQPTGLASWVAESVQEVQKGPQPSISASHVADPFVCGLDNLEHSGVALRVGGIRLHRRGWSPYTDSQCQGVHTVTRGCDATYYTP